MEFGCYNSFRPTGDHCVFLCIITEIVISDSAMHDILPYFAWFILLAFAVVMFIKKFIIISLSCLLSVFTYLIYPSYILHTAARFLPRHFEKKTFLFLTHFNKKKHSFSLQTLVTDQQLQFSYRPIAHVTITIILQWLVELHISTSTYIQP